MPTFLIFAGLVLFVIGLCGLRARRSKRREARRQVVEGLLGELRGMFMRRIPVRCQVNGNVSEKSSLVSIRPPHGGEVILTRSQARKRYRYGIRSWNITGIANFAAELPSTDFPGGLWYKRPLEELFGILAHTLRPPDPQERQAFRRALEDPRLN